MTSRRNPNTATPGRGGIPAELDRERHERALRQALGISVLLAQDLECGELTGALTTLVARADERLHPPRRREREA